MSVCGEKLEYDSGEWFGGIKYMVTCGRPPDHEGDHLANHGKIRWEAKDAEGSEPASPEPE